jgi:hypothetical protein
VTGAVVVAAAVAVAAAVVAAATYAGPVAVVFGLMIQVLSMLLLLLLFPLSCELRCVPGWGACFPRGTMRVLRTHECYVYPMVISTALWLESL